MTHFAKNIFCALSQALGDFISFTLSMYIALDVLSLILSNFHFRVPQYQIEPWIILHISLAACCVTWFGVRLRHYFYRKTYWLELKEILRTLVIFAIIEMSVMAFAKWYFSRYVWLLTWILAAILMPLSRILVKKFLNMMGIWMRDTWIIGNGKNARDALNAIMSEKNLGLKVVGFITETPVDEKNSSFENIKVISVNKGWLKSIDKHTQFIVAVEGDQGDIRNTWLKDFLIHGYRYVSVIPTLRGMPLDSTDMAFIFSHEVMIFRVHNNLAKLSSRLMKRCFDIFASVTIIILLSPLLAYISLKVKQDGGNAIYGHLRVGKSGNLFKCLKFRSMVVNSQEVLDDLLRNNPEAKKEWNETFKLKNDPRVTKIGKFLRKTSLDELPQLFNVLMGEMSLVGPRPIITDELEKYDKEVDYYLLSKPGMTGLWQVSGRSDVNYDTRVYLDAWYVKNWSMWNDIAILFKTINVVINKNGAY
ncbi:undecaprenyl-phosphate galactose phosphotransferase WbaP [Pluralibacter gergoviae]|nr:undecaprenyl-phosphate galactose phosphotransferase WbaP [Pluralibacter gergoviae]